MIVFFHRRSQHLLRSAEHIRTHHNVLVLFTGRAGTERAEILVVEEILDHAANAAVLGHHGARFPTVIHQLQLPKSVRLVDRHARRHVLLPIQRVLQTTVFETVKTKGNSTSTAEYITIPVIFVFVQLLDNTNNRRR